MRISGLALGASGYEKADAFDEDELDILKCCLADMPILLVREKLLLLSSSSQGKKWGRRPRQSAIHDWRVRRESKQLLLV